MTLEMAEQSSWAHLIYHLHSGFLQTFCFLELRNRASRKNCLPDLRQSVLRQVTNRNSLRRLAQIG